MEPLPTHSSLSEGRTRTYLDSGLSPTRTSHNGNVSFNNVNQSYGGATDLTLTGNVSAINNQSSTTLSSPLLHGSTSDNAHPPPALPSQQPPGQGSRNIRAMVNTLRETSVLLGEAPAALTAIERRRLKELGNIDELLPKGSYVNGHFASYDNEAATLMGNATTAAIASPLAVGGGAAVAGADFLDEDEDENGNIARDEDRELPYTFLSATGLPKELETPDPTRVVPQLIKEIITHTAARQRTHLRLFFDNLQDFLTYDDTTNTEWEMLLATLFVLARRRGGLTVLQRRYHEDVSELSFDILFALLGTPEENPKFPQVLTVLNALMRKLGCKKETEMLEQFFVRPELTPEDTNSAQADLKLRQVDGVFPTWETDDDADDIQNEKDEVVTGDDEGDKEAVVADAANPTAEDNGLIPNTQASTFTTEKLDTNADDLRLFVQATKVLPAHPFYYSLDSLPDPVDRGDLTEDEFLLLESWFRSLPASVSLLGGDEGGTDAHHNSQAETSSSQLSLVDSLRLVGAAMIRVKQSSTFTHSRGELFVGRGYLGSRYISDKTLRNFQAQFAGVITPTGKRLPGGTCSFFQLMNFLFPTCPEKTLLRRCQMVVLSDHIVTMEKLLHPQGRIQNFLREQYISNIMSSQNVSREVAVEKLTKASSAAAPTVTAAPPAAAGVPTITVPATITSKTTSPVTVVGRRTSSASRGSRPPTPNDRRPSAGRGSSATRRMSTAASPSPAPAPTLQVPTSSPPTILLPPLTLSTEASAALKQLTIEERNKFMAGHHPSPIAAEVTPTTVAATSGNNPETTTEGGKAVAKAPSSSIPSSDKRMASRPMTPVGTTTQTAAQLAVTPLSEAALLQSPPPAIITPATSPTRNEGKSPTRNTSVQHSTLSPVTLSAGLGAVSVPAPGGSSSPTKKQNVKDNANNDDKNENGPKLPSALLLVQKIASGPSQWAVEQRLRLLQRTDWGSGGLNNELKLNMEVPSCELDAEAEERQKRLAEEYAIGSPIKLKSPSDRTTSHDLFPSKNPQLLNPVTLTVPLTVVLLEWFHRLDWTHSGAVTVQQLVDLAETQQALKKFGADNKKKQTIEGETPEEISHIVYCGDWRIDLDELLEYKQGSVTYKHHQDRVTKKAPTQHGNQVNRSTYAGKSTTLHNVTLEAAEAEAIAKRREAQIKHLPPTLVITFEDIMRYLFLDLENPPAPAKGPLFGNALNVNGVADQKSPSRDENDPAFSALQNNTNFSGILHQPFLRSRLDEFTNIIKAATDIYIAQYNALIASTMARNEGYKVELLNYVNEMNDNAKITANLQKKVNAVLEAYAEKASPVSASSTLLPPLTPPLVPLSVIQQMADVVCTNPAGDNETALPHILYVPKTNVPAAAAPRQPNTSVTDPFISTANPENENKSSTEAKTEVTLDFQCTTSSTILQFAAAQRTLYTHKRTLAARHNAVKQYKNGRRRELIAEAMRSQFDFIQKSLQEHVPREVGPFLKAPPVYVDLYGLSVNDTILDLSYFASRHERRLQVRELLITLDQSGIPARYFVKDQRLHAAVPVPGGLSGSSGTLGAVGVYGSGGEYAFCGPIHIYRDFAFCTQRPSQNKHWPTGVLQSIQIITNIPVKSGVKFRFHLEGYNFGANRPINSVVVGSADKRFESVGTLEYFGWPDRWDQDTILNKGNGVETVAIYVSEKGKGFVCIELQAKSFMHVGFGVSAWLLQHGHGGKHPLSVRFVHSDQRL